MSQEMSVQKQKTELFNNFNSINKENISVIRQYATIIKCNTTSIDMFIDLKHSTDVKWVGQNDPREPLDNIDIKKSTLNLHEMYTSTIVSKTFLNNLNDSLEKLIENKVFNSMNYLELKGFLYGTGENEPQGLLSKEGKQTIKKENIIKTILNMYNSIDPYYHNGLIWIMNKEFISDLLTINDQLFTKMLCMSSNNGRLSLLGFPVYTLDMLNKQHQCVLINVSASYCIGDYNNNPDTLVDYYSHKPNVEFYFVKYVGGMVTNTKSYVVCEKE